MLRFVSVVLLAVALLIPSSTYAQSGDATWLNNMEGLETGIGRSWAAPFTVSESSTIAEVNVEGTVTAEHTTWSTPEASPEISDEMQTSMLSALIYHYDSTQNAAQGIELFHEAQLDQISRDPRNPATNEFEPEIKADVAFGNEGSYEVPDLQGGTSEMAVVYILAQDGELIYQVFGVFLPGQHIEIATSVAEEMIAADIGDAEPMHDMNGDSTGGLWEKLNAIDIAMPEDSTIADLQVYPPADDAVMGDSVVVPQIDLHQLGTVPGMQGSWHITYVPAETGVMMATPDVVPEGVFNIELWVLNFDDATYATAAAVAMSNALIEPLGVTGNESGNLGSGGITLVNSGFVRDRSIPEGDAATVVVADGTTLYAARVYSNGPAPTPLAQDLIDGMVAAEPGDAAESVAGNDASGGMWDIFPQPGDDLLYGLEPANVRYAEPSAEPDSTPVG